MALTGADGTGAALTPHWKQAPQYSRLLRQHSAYSKNYS